MVASDHDRIRRHRKRHAADKNPRDCEEVDPAVPGVRDQKCIARNYHNSKDVSYLARSAPIAPEASEKATARIEHRDRTAPRRRCNKELVPGVYRYLTRWKQQVGQIRTTDLHDWHHVDAARLT
jgi:hypothetical protein